MRKLLACLVNGRDQQNVPVSDRGLSYGDGVFETLAVCHGQIRLWDAHYSRLRRACKGLALKPVPDKQLLAREIRQVSSQLSNKADRCVVKLIVTRGSGGRGYDPDSAGPARRIVQCFDWPVYARDTIKTGIATKICKTRLARQPALAGIKHLNRLEQVLARQEIRSPYSEGLMCDEQGNLIEGTMSNLFLVRENSLYTPALSQCGVRGVMRDVVLTTAEGLGFSVIEGRLDLTDLDSAQEVFVTNSLIGIWPVNRVGQRKYQIGPCALRLRQELSGVICG